MPRQTIGGRYELEQPLGGSAMSAVWLAHDRELERKVAVKLLAPDADRARFEREAQAVAGLGHPNICQLYDYGESEDGPYMVLEYLPGGTLEERLAAGAPVPDGEAMRIAQEGAAGLAHAHERGLVHRDLKPANILFDSEDRVKIADFGIARIEGGRELTVAGTVLGTAAYISPEQASGLAATPASDVYSFGVILFRMLTGRTPFESESAMELLRMHQQEPAPAVESLRSDAPTTLAAVTQAALAKDPAARPPDGAALLAALSGSGDPGGASAAGAATQIVSGPLGDGSQTQVIRRPRPTRRPRRTLPAALAGAVVLALVGLAAAFVLTKSGSGTDGAAATSIPSLSLPTVGRQTTVLHSTTSAVSSTAAATTGPTTSSTSSTSSTRQATTAAATRAVTTTPSPAPATTAPLPATTVAPPTTTTTATTAAVTTDPAATTIP